ncbi:hypothetical protein [Paraburkholderia aromaticivorans]|uniref:hypothetical protein n=1 Tax=Paraburkholderia aromaticivorans TaxID=2026199 RepID=UPI001455FAE3|nr:hypothetical protein [Paraburkholderia aromaticivorans]
MIWRRSRQIADRKASTEEERKQQEKADHERRLKLFDDLQADIDKRDLATSDGFDKSILTYASGGLGFSLLLYKDVLPHSTLGIPVALQLSWMLFTLAILAIVLSYLITPKLLSDQLDLGERWLVDCDKSADRPSKWEPVVTYTAYAAGAFFVAAIALTVYVAISGSAHLPVGSAATSVACAPPTDQRALSTQRGSASDHANKNEPAPLRNGH